jgi:cell division protein FtsB
MAVTAPDPSPLSAETLKRIRRIAGFQIAAMVVIGVLTAFLAVQITQLSKQRADLRDDLSAESKRLETLQAETGELTRKRAELEESIKTLQDRNLSLRADLTRQDATVGILERLDPAATNRAVSLADKTPRLYIQVATPDNEKLAQTLRSRLERAGFLVPRVERLPTTSKSLQVRYFRTEDAADAQKIVDLIRAELPGVAAVSFAAANPNSRMRPRHLELWF